MVECWIYEGAHLCRAVGSLNLLGSRLEPLIYLFICRSSGSRMGPDSAVQVPGWRPCGSDYVLCKIFSREVGMPAAIDDVRLVDFYYLLPRRAGVLLFLARDLLRLIQDTVCMC